MDEASAAPLVDSRKVASYFDPDKDDAGAVARSAPRRGNAHARQVVDADIPGAPAQPADKPDTALADVGKTPQRAGDKPVQLTDRKRLK